jgi:nucleoside-diphosphate-sugar epimerase
MTEGRRALVTGAAGFIGSHLAERLLADGWQVTGVDCYTDYYARSVKEENLEAFRRHPGFAFVEADLVTADVETLVAGNEVIFHQAGQAGVRASWGVDFQIYTQNYAALSMPHRVLFMATLMLCRSQRIQSRSLCRPMA